MLVPTLPENEKARLAALQNLKILDTPTEERFERITRLATHYFNIPIALITLLDANRQWFKSCIGMDFSESSRDISFCGHAILGDEPFVIPDATQDPRFADNPLVTGEPYIRFYAGQPLSDEKGYKFGTLCIIDQKPREISKNEIQILKDLAVIAQNELTSFQLNEALAQQRESELKMRAIMDSIADGIICFDEQGTIETFNPAAECIFGYSAAEILGKNVTALLPLSSQGLADWQLSHQLFQENRYKLTGREREIMACRKDGSTFQMDVAISEVRHEEKKQLVAAVRDISERKEIENKLNRTLGELETQYRDADRVRGELRAILDAVSEAIVLVSPDREIKTVDHQFSEMFGVSLEQILGRKFEELDPLVEKVFADPAAFKAGVAGSVSDTNQQFNQVISQKWPVPRELTLFSTPVKSANNTYLGRLYVFRDVTHEREVDRLKSEFVSMVSHELRTPLTSIRGYIELILDEDAGEVNEEQIDYLNTVQNNVDRLLSLVNDLLDISRIESGKIELQLTSLNLKPIVENVASSMLPLIEAKQQKLTLDLPNELPLVMGDANRLTQIVSNLLSNAYKYTLAGGEITIRVYSEGEQIWVAVSDTGIGLSPEDQAKLFSRFFRARNETTQEVGGTGLGLVITKSLVELHGGEITLSSVAGKGSTFSFSLRVAPQQNQEELAPVPPPIPVGGKILVVDDEPDIANLIKRYLERAGYEVVTAFKAVDAFRLAQTEQPDLITLDLVLPDADGFTLLEWLKSEVSTAKIPVMLLSVMEDTKQGKLLGAVDYLTKPVQEGVLQERIGRILSDELFRLVLIVDDDKDLRDLLSRNLERAGYEVIAASGGEEAIEMVHQYKPSLALIDVNMPGMDGISVLSYLRREPETRNLPVIMMTASPGVLEETWDRVASIGGATLINKPGTMDELVEAIAHGLSVKNKQNPSLDLIFTAKHSLTALSAEF